ncbi:hypothetical protein DERP_002428 [Dermatophagoides pteronyssinus]|uniref:Uncharacterized protein n=1 Tax=Dermatophagoides pteronyssinus TaxID=6956 RepID=A0ABQ8JHP2_DERPT|nr:hypothetical protein DERP_002428 [Dermatophagoides pteronyssinus]
MFFNSISACEIFSDVNVFDNFSAKILFAQFSYSLIESKNLFNFIANPSSNPSQIFRLNNFNSSHFFKISSNCERISVIRSFQLYHVEIVQKLNHLIVDLFWIKLFAIILFLFTSSALITTDLTSATSRLNRCIFTAAINFCSLIH